MQGTVSKVDIGKTASSKGGINKAQSDAESITVYNLCPITGPDPGTDSGYLWIRPKIDIVCYSVKT